MRPAGTPRPRTLSDAAGLLARGSKRLSGLPDGVSVSDTIDSRSPLTVAGTAPESGHGKTLTGFPLSSGPQGPQNRDPDI